MSASDQSPMPPQQGVWRDHCVEFQQRLTADRLRLPRKQSPLRIGEAKPFASELLFQDPILGLRNSMTTNRWR